jgi:ubiquinone/menaquinone biosynthesis C-methylase UbiE
MTRETEVKLASSLTAETTELLPFLPYLLQDFWELGSEPDVVAELIGKHVGITASTRILDLACGKGAVSVKIAQKLNVKVKGIDLLPAFVEYAAQKAKEYGVSDLCDFTVGDINEAVKTERDYDCVVFIATGNLLGNPAETLDKLKAVIKPGGYIVIDECYLSGNGSRADVKYVNNEYLTEKEWKDIFNQAALDLLEAVSGEDSGSDSGMAFITARANELIQKHPDRKTLFEGYIQSQQNEYDDIDNTLDGATWILRKR